MHECSDCVYFKAYPGGYDECDLLHAQLNFGKKRDECPGITVPHGCGTCKYWKLVGDKEMNTICMARVKGEYQTDEEYMPDNCPLWKYKR